MSPAAAARRKAPTKPPKPPAPPVPQRATDPLLRAFVDNVQTAYGVDEASTFELQEHLSSPRGFVGTRNIALERAIGAPGLPLGRVTEISGWPGAGKSTILDQIFAQCQEEDGLGVLADTEKVRVPKYMKGLDVAFERLANLKAKTAETMFDEAELIARTAAHHSALGWVRSLSMAGYDMPPSPTYKFEVWAPNAGPKAKPIASFVFAQWTREHAAVLLRYQREHELHQTSVRDAATRAVLQPRCVLAPTPAEEADAIAAWEAEESHPFLFNADRPIVFGWDSVAGTPTEAELEGSARDQHPATAAKVIRRNLRRLVQFLDDTAIAFVIINQRYERIPMGPNRFVTGSETYGGGGIKYHTTIRIEVDKIGDIMPPGSKDDDPPMGQIVRLTVPKNKLNDPFRVEDFGLIFGRGADNAWPIYQDLKQRGIIRAGGAWSHFTDPTILGDGPKPKSFQGWTGLSNLCADVPGLWHKVKELYLDGRR